MTPTPNIAKALLACQRALTAVDKAGRNDAGYAYTKADDLIREVRLVLLDHGVTVRRTGWRVIENGQLVASRFELCHPDSGEREAHEAELPVVADEERPHDKAVMAALTTTWGYWLRDLLALERRDGVEVDARHDGRRQEQRREEHPARQQQAAMQARFEGLAEQMNELKKIYDGLRMNFSEGAQRHLRRAHAGKPMGEVLDLVRQDCLGFKQGKRRDGQRPRYDS